MTYLLASIAIFSLLFWLQARQSADERKLMLDRHALERANLLDRIQAPEKAIWSAPNGEQPKAYASLDDDAEVNAALEDLDPVNG